MGVSYDVFAEAFLDKITEYRFLKIPEENRISMIDGYMKRAIAKFAPVCKYDLSDYDDAEREFVRDIQGSDLWEITDIISEGMVVQWLKPYCYHADNMELLMSNSDFQHSSPGELYRQIQAGYQAAKKDFSDMIREYSYVHGDLGDLSS